MRDTWMIGSRTFSHRALMELADGATFKVRCDGGVIWFESLPYCSC
jgi:hypothetical protein